METLYLLLFSNAKVHISYVKAKDSCFIGGNK